MEGEGQRVGHLRQTGVLLPTWQGSDCCTAGGPTRVYVGVDGFMAPMVTKQEKQKRRARGCGVGTARVIRSSS